MAEDTKYPAELSEKAPAGRKSIESTILRPYPKVVFFWPAWIAMLVCGIVTALQGSDPVEGAASRQFWTYLFLWIFSFNLIVIAFEFSRILSVAALFLVLSVLFLGLWLGFLGSVFAFFDRIKPEANYQFFFFLFVVFTIIYIVVFVQTRFNYWEVRKNELLHKHGFLGDVKRYHAQGVKIDKNITDIFEFLLLRSGTIVIYPADEDRAIVLENVIGINRKSAEVKEILESYAIRIDRD